jgi:hypothetical protein
MNKEEKLYTIENFNNNKFAIQTRTKEEYDDLTKLLNNTYVLEFHVLKSVPDIESEYRLISKNNITVDTEIINIEQLQKEEKENE